MAFATNPNFKAPPMPAFVPQDLGQLQQDASQYDVQASDASNALFAQQNPALAQAQKTFQQNVAAQQTGNATFMPQLQNELMTAGIGQSLGSLGSGSVAGGTLAAGGAGQADVARNLGLDVLGFQQSQTQQAQQSLGLAENIFPHQSVGLSGADAAGVSEANNLGQNNWNQANYDTQFQTDQLNWLNQAQNTQAKVQSENQATLANAMQNSAIWQGIFQSIGGVVGAAGGAAASGVMSGGGGTAGA